MKMRAFLRTVRMPETISEAEKTLHSVLILVCGIMLGVLAKALDETASNALPVLLETLDLRNFFSRMGFWLFSGICISVFSKTPQRAALNSLLFFAGMVGSYYTYTVLIAGFFPKAYMMIWIAITLLTPLLGAACWYARGVQPLSVLLSVLIFVIMTRQAFYFGFWYLDVSYGLELILWFAMIVVLYQSPKQIAWVIGAGTVLFCLTASFYPFGGMI